METHISVLITFRSKLSSIFQSYFQTNGIRWFASTVTAEMILTGTNFFLNFIIIWPNIHHLVSTTAAQKSCSSSFTASEIAISDDYTTASASLFTNVKEPEQRLNASFTELLQHGPLV